MRIQDFRFLFFVLCLCSFIAACGGSDPVQNELPGAPRITELKTDPEVICVGSASNISFHVSDPNEDPVTWKIELSSNIHGLPEQTTGTNPSGSEVIIRFKAATSGRHQHRVSMTVSGNDPGGLQAEPAKADLYVFNCG
jgi:hypothetical protein